MEVSSLSSRKVVSTSAVDKLKKKRRKKRKLKEGKRSSASSTSATGSPDSLGRPRKSRSTYSCPSVISPIKACKERDEIEEVCQNFNDSLRWLPYIVTYSQTVPPKSSNSRLCSPIVSKILNSPVGVSETLEEEEERIALYKMNRRKRYLAAQQALLSLYPDANIYAGASNVEGKHKECDTNIDRQRSNHLMTPHSDMKNDVSDSICNFESKSYELAVTSMATHVEAPPVTQAIS